jgi:hypothetical protein
MIRLFPPPYGENDAIVLPAMGRSYGASTNMIAREERAASGKLRRDIIASKQTFKLDYDAIDDAALAVYEDLYENYKYAELRLEITHGEKADTYVVLIKAFSKRRRLAVWGGLWEGVSVEFEEV